MELRGGMISVSVALVFLLSCFCSDFGIAIDTITSSQYIIDPKTITSSGGTFKLGFFSPGNSSNRYVGIWYNKGSGNAIVWVANRNKPLINDSSGIVIIHDDGNLVVLNGHRDVLWSSNVSNSVINASAQLLDTGNLVLNDRAGGVSLWESFQEPTDALLPGMKISTNLRTGKKLQLTSWRSLSDPSIGNFSCSLQPLNFPEIFVWNLSRPHWRTGQWNGRKFNGVPTMNSVYVDGIEIEINDPPGNSYFFYPFANVTMYVVLTSQGFLEERDWVDEEDDWGVSFWRPKNDCDSYGWCGPFGTCNSEQKPICSCLGGFEPMNMEEWNRGNFTSGCVRRKPLQCERMNKTGNVGKEDGFLKLDKMKLPDFPERSSGLEDECRVHCLSNCSCVAYAYDASFGCMKWRGSLIDMQKFSLEAAVLYIRLAHSELDTEDKKVVIIIAVIVGTITITICAIFSCSWTVKRGAKAKRMMLQLDELQVYTKRSSVPEIMNPSKLQDLPLLNFEELAAATNWFHLMNKLGQGGFGPVYRGKLRDGQEIAVKRLSKESGQGLEEFMNEVMLISKLQHRNLVRLLGCCVEGEEKMLIYEYMPNQSLDAFLFDPSKGKLLDWRNRFNIIEGISRGLLYLHRDSRLRIIHRDLKASNILLDEELNPKISDFGMARIFGGKQDQAKTIRVVGTYGYMSPEYAMHGQFSEKSDVFSFGVLLLEIVSGRRNTSFYHDEYSLTLLGYAWKLWNENNIVAFIDPVISELRFQSEFRRCINVGLLCVQEFVKDRPSMSTVMSMLNSEIVDLPAPKQPAFTERQNAVDAESSEQSQNRCSINNVTITVIEAR